MYTKPQHKGKSFKTEDFSVLCLLLVYPNHSLTPVPEGDIFTYDLAQRELNRWTEALSSQKPVLYVHLGCLLMTGFSDRNFQTAVNPKAITTCLNPYSITNSAFKYFHFK